MQQSTTKIKETQSSISLLDLKNLIINDRYQIIDKIQETSTYIEYIAFDHQTQVKYVVKCIDFQQIQKEKGQEFKRQLRRISKVQTNVMQSANPDQDYICSCAESIETNNMKMIVQEYFPGNTLSHKVRKGLVYTESDALLIIKQIIKGYQYLRQKMVPLLCLQPDDIMECYGKYKIVNFGYTKLQGIEKIMKENKQISDPFETKSFIAPQILKNQFYNSKVYVWNIGMLLFYMLNSRISSNAVKPILSDIQLIETFNVSKIRASPAVTNFILQCLQPNPLKRLSWNELIKHEIFSIKNEHLTSYALVDEQISNLQLIDRHYYLHEEQKYLNSLLQETIIQKTTQYKIEKIKMIYSMAKEKDLNQKKYELISNCHLLLMQSQWNYENLIKFFIYQDNQNRSIVSFKYLLLNRCYINLSDSLRQLMPMVKKNDLLAKSIYELINAFFKNSIQQQFKKTCSELTNLENSWKNIFSDWLSNNKEKIKERCYFEGFEKYDFKKDQQISFTTQYYQKQILKLVPKSNNESVEFLKLNFKKYNEVNFVSCQSLKKKEKCFFEFVTQLDKVVVDKEVQEQSGVRSLIYLDQKDQFNSNASNKKQQK